MFATSFGRLLTRNGRKTLNMFELNQYINKYYSIGKWVFHNPRIAINIIRILLSKIKKLNNKNC